MARYYTVDSTKEKWITLLRQSAGDRAKKEGDGYDAEFNCDYFDYPPFLFNLFHSTPTVSIQRAVMLHVMNTM